MKTSRTYKLRLSEQGIDLFLQCHIRVAILLRDFIPYGTTLSTAIAILDLQDACDVSAELATAKCDLCLGKTVRYVGASIGLVDRMARITDRLLKENEFFTPPTGVRLFVAALMCLEAAEDAEILAAAALGRRSGQRATYE